MSGCYEGWTLEWRDWVLVGTGPDGQHASLGEVWTDSTGAHYELLDPIGGDRFHTAKAANRPTAQRIATNLARRVGATFLPSAPALAAEPSAPEGSVARPTDVAAQPGSGESGGEASPGASAPQAGPPSAREPETVGAEPAPVTGSSHAPLPAGDAPSPAVGTPGMHRQGDVSGVRVGPWEAANFGMARTYLDSMSIAVRAYPYDHGYRWHGWLAGAIVCEDAPSWPEAADLADAWLIARGVELPGAETAPPSVVLSPVAQAKEITLDDLDGDGVDETLDTIEDERDARASYDPDRIVAALAALDHEDVLAERWEERCREAHERIAELEAAQQPARDAFDAAVAAHARIAELEEAVQELATARADLALVDDILDRICGPTIPDDRRVRLGVLLARAPRWT